MSALGLALTVPIALLVPPALENAGENERTDREFVVVSLSKACTG